MTAGEAGDQVQGRRWGQEGLLVLSPPDPAG